MDTFLNRVHIFEINFSKFRLFLWVISQKQVRKAKNNLHRVCPYAPVENQPTTRRIFSEILDCKILHFVDLKKVRQKKRVGTFVHLK